MRAANKLAVVTLLRSAANLCSFFLRFITSQKDLFAVQKNVNLPFFISNIPCNPCNTRSAIKTNFDISHILRARSSAKIRTAIIQTITVSMVSSPLYSKDEIVHPNPSRTRRLDSVIPLNPNCINLAVITHASVPSPLTQPIKIGCVNNRGIALGEKYQARSRRRILQ